MVFFYFIITELALWRIDSWAYSPLRVSVVIQHSDSYPPSDYILRLIGGNSHMVFKLLLVLFFFVRLNASGIGTYQLGRRKATCMAWLLWLEIFSRSCSLPDSIFPFHLNITPRSSLDSLDVKANAITHPPQPNATQLPAPSICLLFCLIPWHHLFILLVSAILSSIASGGIASFMTIVVGEAFNAFAQSPPSYRTLAYLASSSSHWLSA